VAFHLRGADVSPCLLFLFQEKYKRDQEKLQEEWLKDQEEVARSADQQEVTTHFTSIEAQNLKLPRGLTGNRSCVLCVDDVNDSA